MNKNTKIRVKHSGVISLQYFDDFPDGALMIAENKKSVPFNIKRVYYITNLYNKRSRRGFHAHKKLEQYIFCVRGSFTLLLDDGSKKQRLTLDTPYLGVRLGSKLWHEMSNFSSDCVILVLADDFYKESDYIRDYNAFLKYIETHKK